MSHTQPQEETIEFIISEMMECCENIAERYDYTYGMPQFHVNDKHDVMDDVLYLLHYYLHLWTFKTPTLTLKNAKM